MSDKEQNFASAVIYLHNDGERVVQFLNKVNEQLSAHFLHFEIIAVDNACRDNAVPLLRKWAATMAEPLTIIRMSLAQSQEACMNAGLHASIGDYVFEFDSTDAPYPAELMMQAYTKTQEGYDIVSVCPSHGTGLASSLFYALFNGNSHSAYPLRSECFRVVTRRAINRVHANSEHLPYRKAAYATSGLKQAYLEWKGRCRESTYDRLSLAVNSLALYTNTAYRAAVAITLFMMMMSLAAMAYAIYIFCTGNPVAGWTTTMLVLTFGFTGLSAAAAIIIKYLDMLLTLIFHRQHYRVEGIERIQK